jgi:hypothetical protein
MRPSSTKAEDLFQKTLREARIDANIIGFWLDGSRGKGIISEHSDYDCTMLVTDAVFDQYKERYREFRTQDVELRVMTLAEFKSYAAWGSETAWDRYNFAHLEPLVDRTGVLQELFQEKSRVPDNVRKAFVAGQWDYYVNQVYRSLKCFRDGQSAGGRLEAAESVTPLLKAIFGLHGRVRPFFKYLDWELKAYPLENLAMPGEGFLEAILKILETGSVPAQQGLLTHMEVIARADEYGDVFDAWGQKLGWMKDFVLVSPQV